MRHARLKLIVMPDLKLIVMPDLIGHLSLLAGSPFTEFLREGLCE